MIQPGNAVDSTPMDDDELIAILRAEEVDAASFFTSELATAQSEAMDRYYGALYGNEIDGRSKITTHDIEDTINWMMPDLMRVFMSGEDLVTCTPSKPEDEPNTDLAAEYLEFILMQDNPGIQLIHDFIFDGLLQRIGVVSVMWEDPKPKPPEILKGVSPEQLMRLLQDPEYEILEQAESEQTLPGEQQPHAQLAPPQGQPGQPGQPLQAQPEDAEPDNDTDDTAMLQPAMPEQMPTFDLKVQRTPKMGKVRIENVPPEEIAFSRRARSFPNRDRSNALTAPYVRRKQQRYLGDLLKEFPEFKADLETGSAGEGQHTYDMDNDPRVLSRFQNESVSIGNEVTNSSHRRKVDLLTEYIWVDFDGDGTVELRRVIRVENTILDNVAVDDCEFKTWSPIRVAHKAVGRSVADTIIDLQKVRTTIMRLMLDGLSQSLVPRTIVNTQMVDEQGIDDLLDAEIGGVVRVKGDVTAAVKELVNPDVSQNALTAIEYIDQKSEQQSGVTRHAQGISPDAITKTASGIENLQAAAGERIEMVARWAGLALEDILKRVLQLVVQNQDRPRWVKIKGKPLDVDPRTWSDEMGVKVHVGMGGSNRQTQLANLAGIAAKQEQAIAASGPSNPVCDVTHLVNTYSRMTEVMGFKDPSKFWHKPEQTKQALAQIAAQPPKPDPKTLEVQQKGEIAKQQLQLTAADNAQKLQIEQMKVASDEKIALIKAAAEQKIAREQMLLQAQMDKYKIAMQAKLQRESDARNHQLKKEQSERDHEVNLASIKEKKDRPGGRLDA